MTLAQRVGKHAEADRAFSGTCHLVDACSFAHVEPPLPIFVT